MKAPAGRHKDLVLVRAGHRSLHPGWMAPSEDEQTFDLIVLCYEPTFLALDRGDFGHFDIPGYKIAGYGAFFSEHRDLVERYERVALIDDDVETDSQRISRAFELGRIHDLDLWQPTLTWDSHFSYIALLHWAGSAPLRRVNFVEMMCPFFKVAALLEIEDLFQSGAETAVDIFWSCVLGHRGGDLAVLNNVSFTHTRPVGVLKAMNGFSEASKGYGDEISRLMINFGIPKFPGAIPLKSPLDQPRSLAARLASALAMLGVLGGLMRTPMRPHLFLWILLNDILKVLFRKAQIPGDPDRIIAHAKAVRLERERRDQEPGNGAA